MNISYSSYISPLSESLTRTRLKAVSISSGQNQLWRRIRSGMRATTLVLTTALVCLPGVASAQSQTDSIITRTVVAEPGDTLRSIARREFGKSGMSPLLANFNALNESDPVIPGQIIRIPLFTPVERQFATAIFIKGEVSKNTEELKRGDKVYLNELIITGDNGFASLQFSSGSVVNLNSNTHAKVEKLNCLESDESCLIVLDSAQGEVSSDVNRREGQPTEFTIKTPYASAAVRGTFFEMNALADKMLIGVTEGEVLLQDGVNDLSLDVGFGSVAQPNTVPEAIALLPAPVYRFIPTRAARGDNISWWGLTDASQYLINLSTDEDGLDVIANYTESQGRLPIGELDAGEYIMNVRGVDTNGLKGFWSPTKIIVAEIDESVQPVDTNARRVGNEFLVEVVEPPESAAGYEIQVSTTEDFSDPLSVDVANEGSALFRLESDVIFSRARVLIDPEKVSAFGTVAQSN